MKFEVKTTITTRIDIDTLVPEHSVEIEGEAGVPEQVARAAAIGGCRAALVSLGVEKGDIR
ncbi:MAG: hypothetical protein ACTH4Y_08245 [Microbacterium gubbeenense]|uniref:hypothetical protein n=1 Tax=Microbacterium gubbeenense TaxID=159896 RepID=UPI003F996E68